MNEELKSPIAGNGGLDSIDLIKIINKNRFKQLLFTEFIKYVTIMLIRC